MKAYDPSDGVKRILWKTYAKSGDLMVRRPEPAVLPEGEVCIYLVANKNEDYVCGAFRSYLEQLQTQQIQILFGTDGLTRTKEEAASFQIRQEEMLRTIVHSVWSDETGTGRGFARYLSSLREQTHGIHQVIVFGPERSDGWFDEMKKVASLHSVLLSVALVPERVSAPAFPRPNIEPKAVLPKRMFHHILNPSHYLFSRKDAASQERSLGVAIPLAGAKLMICEAADS